MTKIEEVCCEKCFCHDSMNIDWMKVRLEPTDNAASEDCTDSAKTKQQQKAHFSVCYPMQQ